MSAFWQGMSSNWIREGRAALDRAFSRFFSEPTIRVWFPHQASAANGAEDTKDFKSWTWTAKGGWSGILETA
jgi:hypothetical protein